MRRHWWPIALLIVAAIAFCCTGAVVQREVAARYELTRGAAGFCQALTREGRPCRNRTKDPSGFCWRHRPAYAPRATTWDRT